MTSAASRPSRARPSPSPSRSADVATDAAADAAITIDELAQRCGTTVRTIREYQTLGVLPPPRKQGRMAVYDEGHVARLHAVDRLQARGYSLAAIADLLSAWETGSSLPTVLGLGDEPSVGAMDEVPVIVSADDLRAELPELFATTRLARRAVRVGLVGALDGDRFLVRSPAMVQLVAELVAAGLPAAEGLEVVEGITSQADALAAPAADLVMRYVIGPSSSTTTGDEATDAPASSDSSTAASTDASAGARRSADEVAHRLRRARLLLAQAAATTLVDRIAGVLTDRAADDPDLAAVLARIRVGQVRDTTTPTTPT